MQINTINEHISVCAQISEEDVEAIAEAGFRTILCNRPDEEEPGQPDQAAIAQKAEELGVRFIYQPVISGAMTMEDVTGFSAILDECEAPVLAYCRTGTRCTALWSLTEKLKGTAPETIISQAAGAGYDMSALIRS